MARPKLALLSLAVLVLTSGCLGVAPESDTSPPPSVEYEPFDVRVEGWNETDNGTATVAVRATLKEDHPAFLAPDSPITSVRNVTVSVEPADRVLGDPRRQTDPVEPGETAAWTYSVCRPADNTTTLTATVDGTVYTADGPADVGPGWARSNDTTTLSPVESGDEQATGGGGGGSETDLCPDESS